MTISIQEINIFKINFNNHINKINYVLKKKNIYNILTNNRMLGWTENFINIYCDIVKK